MKKFTALLCAVIICTGALLLSSCGKTDPDVPSGMKLASSEDADYIMYVPEMWRVDRSTLYTSAFYSSGDATSISCAAYGMNYTDRSVDDWWNSFEDEMKSLYTDVSDIQKAEASLGGVSGQKYTFSASLNGTEYNYIITAALKSNYIYYVTYTSTPDYYENHLEELDSVIANFAFK